MYIVVYMVRPYANGTCSCVAAAVSYAEQIHSCMHSDAHLLNCMFAMVRACSSGRRREIDLSTISNGLQARFEPQATLRLPYGATLWALCSTAQQLVSTLGT